jgi:hypothetical protein
VSEGPSIQSTVLCYKFEKNEKSELVFCKKKLKWIGGLSSNSINNNKTSNMALESLPDKAVFLTVWLKEDREQEHGMGRWFDTLDEAIKRFLNMRNNDQLYAAVIDRGDNVIMTWHK